MALKMSFTVNTDEFKKGLDETRDRYGQAMAVSRNMIASMMQTQVAADVAGAGKYDTRAVSTLVEGDTITTTIDVPGADLLESGGTIYGHPLLWIPFSGTDAEGIQASSYGDKLFSVNRLTGGVPMLFSIKDRAPKYFGVPNVNVPKKFHVADIQQRVMASLKDIFESALGNG
jgi:hypothetical protein